MPTPETEILCESAIRFIKQKKIEHPKIIDIGTGSGVISVTLANELDDCTILTIDISEDAIAVAKKNAKSLGNDDRINIFRCSFFDKIQIEKDE